MSINFVYSIVISVESLEVKQNFKKNKKTTTKMVAINKHNIDILFKQNPY
jgi:hypothetical protein